MDRNLLTCLTFLTVTVAHVPASSALAALPQVRFDVSCTVACYDVTPPEFAVMNPHERLVEARFQVSSLVHEGSEDDLIQYFYSIECPERCAQIVDYQPQTTLATDYASNIGVEKKHENSKTLGAGLTGAFDSFVKASGSAEMGVKDCSTMKYELLPTLELLAASGTIHRGYGVYFKLKPSPRTVLEGAKEFVLVLRVPRDWRGDYVYLRCEASGYRRGVVRPLDEQTRCGYRAFALALYAAGDEAAKHVAAGFVRAETELRRAAASNHSNIRKRSFPTVIHQFGALISVVDPKIPDSWLDRLLHSPAGTPIGGFENRLPPEVRAAAKQYVYSKLALHGLSSCHLPSIATATY
jgi:hypothetical protein